MPEQILNAVLQCRRRGRAAGACALHAEKNDAVLETLERDVAAVIGDGGPHASFNQVLDGRNGLGISRVEELLAVASLGGAAVEQRLARHEMLHDGAEDHRLELLPVAAILAHGDEIGAEEHTADTRDAEQALGKWRLCRFGGLAQIERAAL